MFCRSVSVKWICDFLNSHTCLALDLNLLKVRLRRKKKNDGKQICYTASPTVVPTKINCIRQKKFRNNRLNWSITTLFFST